MNEQVQKKIEQNPVQSNANVNNKVLLNSIQI